MKIEYVEYDKFSQSYLIYCFDGSCHIQRAELNGITDSPLSIQEEIIVALCEAYRLYT